VTAVVPARVQAALVCMLVDPAYAARVYGRDAVPGLSPRERALLREVDARALRADPHRRARALQAVVEELPVSVASIGLAAADAFFSDPAFFSAVFGRGSMALAFATWLPATAEPARAIEGALARARRPARARTPGLCRPGHLVPLVLPEGSVAWYERARAALGPDPVAALAAGNTAPPAPAAGPAREHVLVEVDREGVSRVGTASAALVELLRAAEHPHTRAELAAAAVQAGADPDDAPSLLDDLLAEGLLVEVSRA
jgi:hypothetical protein